MWPLVQFSLSVLSNSLWPRGLKHARLPVHHQLHEHAQTHVHRVSDAIQPSYPLLSSSPPVFNLSQHQGLFQWVSSLNPVAQVSVFQFQHQSFQWVFRVGFPLGLTGLISLLSKGLSRVFSNTTVQKQFFSTQPSLWSNYYIHTWLLKKPYIWLWICVCKVLSLLSHTLSRLVIAFLPRSKHLLIS